MNARATLVLAACLSLGTGGCGIVKKLMSDEKEEPSAAPSAPPPPSAAAAVPSVAPPVAAAAPPITDDSIPTTVDFEEQALELVTKDSLKVRVDDLSREIKEP